MQVDATMCNIKQELAEEGIRPVTPDRDMLKSLAQIAIARDWCKCETQLNTIQVANDRASCFEADYYALVSSLN